MRQLSMIEGQSWLFAKREKETSYNVQLSAWGKALFVAQMKHARTLKRNHGRGSNETFAQVQNCRSQIARLQNALYELDPDGYPQFGALG